MADNDPSAPSSDYKAMLPYWQMIDDIMGGAPTMRAGGEKYLPRFEKESTAEYETRVCTAPFTPIYADAFRNLASKPFGKEVRIGEDSVDALKPLVENIDTAGNHMHIFAREVFKAGINYGLDWILVDYTAMPSGLTLGDERALGARPYWVRIPAKQMLAVYQDEVDGELVFVHARIDESVVSRDGFDEVVTRRIRILNREPLEGGGYAPATFEIWEEQAKPAAPGAAQSTEWIKVSEGPISIGVIALTPFVTGEHELGSWAIRPPLKDLAYMQITEFQMESNRNRVQTMTAFPVFVVQGVSKPDGDLAMGPRTVLWFPPIGDSGSYGDFKFAEPSGAAGKMLSEDLAEFRREMREVGMQPLTPQSGNLTATATAVAEAKAHSAVEAWALALKDALEQAWVYTCMWLGVPEEQSPDVVVHTDFSIGQQSVEEMGVVKDLNDAGLISGEQRVEEAIRRGILAPTYDRNADRERILNEIPGDDDEFERQSALPPARTIAAE